MAETTTFGTYSSEYSSHKANEMHSILKEWKVIQDPIASLSQFYTDEFKPSQHYLFDSQVFFATLCGTPKVMRKLIDTARELGVEGIHSGLTHNAGNDAHVSNFASSSLSSSSNSSDAESFSSLF